MNVRTGDTTYLISTRIWSCLLVSLVVLISTFSGSTLAYAATPTQGDEGGDCWGPDPVRGRGESCYGFGASCLNTYAWGKKCVKCGGKGELCCDKMNIPGGQSRCFDSDTHVDPRFRMACIQGICQNRSKYAARYCGSPGYPACWDNNKKPYCLGSVVLGPGYVCMATGRYYYRTNQRAPEWRLRCFLDVSDFSIEYDYCIPPKSPVTGPHGQPPGPPQPPIPPQPVGPKTSMVDNIPYKKAFGARCDKMRADRADKFCQPEVRSGCGGVAMGCTGYIVTGGLPDKSTPLRSSCGKALLEKYLACVTGCNDRALALKLSWDYVGGCGMDCNRVAEADTKACEAASRP